MTAPVLYLSRRDAAKACGVSVALLDDAVREGKLSGWKKPPSGAGRDNTKVVFSPEALKAWIESWGTT